MFLCRLPYIALLLCAGLLTACGSSSNTSDSPVTPSEGTDSGETDTNSTAEPNSIVNGFRLVRSTRYDEFDKVTQTNELSYDSEANTVTEVQVVIGQGFPDEETTEVMQYDEFGRVLRIERFSRGESNSIENFRFDDSNQLVESQQDGFTPHISTYEFDSVGNLLNWVRINPKLEADLGDEYLPSSGVYTYDENRHLQSATKVVTGFSSGALTVVSGVGQYTTSDTGQLVRLEWQRDDGTAPTITMYSYDGNGNMVERIVSAESYFIREVAQYEPNEEPVYNHWLREFKYFP